MGHKKALDDNKFDVRLVNWNLKRGVVSAQDVKAYKDSLPDSATNARTVEIPMDEENAQDKTLN
tara:strand:+ start:5800 stop:5991 length:192 start_codon:yes stop_codon:yes gene_type:complete